MKYLILFALFSSNILLSQILPGGVSDNYEKPLVKSENPFYFGIGAKYSNLLENNGIETGLVIGGYISQYLSIDFNYYYLFTNNIRMQSNSPDFLNFDYYGLRLNPVLPLFDFLKVKANVGLYLSHVSYGNNINFMQMADLEGDWLLFYEFGGGFDIKIYEPILFTIEANYRLSPNFDLINYSNKSLEGMNVGLVIKVEL